jgi:SAM-dependent methyltransferase
VSSDSNFSTNKRLYESGSVVAGYVAALNFGLTIPEQFCFDRIASEQRGSILDIGVGGGRTCAALSAYFGRYVGVDYSAQMIAAAKTLFPRLDLRVMDARSLAFEEVFDCVFFSFNGIDYVDSKGRGEIFSEMKRVLRPGGYLIYSTHNLAYSRAPALMERFWVSELGRSRRTLRLLINRFRHFRRQSFNDADGVAFINDSGLSFSLITTYVDIDRELATLGRLGFEIEDTIGCRKNIPIYDANDPWVYIIARKSALLPPTQI